MGPKALQLAAAFAVVQLLLPQVHSIRTKLRKQRSKPLQAQQAANGDYDYDYYEGYDDYDDRNGEYYTYTYFFYPFYNIYTNYIYVDKIELCIELYLCYKYLTQFIRINLISLASAVTASRVPLFIH